MKTKAKPKKSNPAAAGCPLAAWLAGAAQAEAARNTWAGLEARTGALAYRLSNLLRAARRSGDTARVAELSAMCAAAQSLTEAAAELADLFPEA